MKNKDRKILFEKLTEKKRNEKIFELLKENADLRFQIIKLEHEIKSLKLRTGVK